MNESYIEFIRSGNLGPVRLGERWETLNEVVGAPDGEHVDPVSSSVARRFGCLDIGLESGHVSYIKVVCLSDGTLPRVLGGHNPPSRTTTIYEVIDLLDDSGIDWSIDPAATFGRQLCLVAGSGTRFYFDLDHRELQYIISQGRAPGAAR